MKFSPALALAVAATLSSPAFAEDRRGDNPDAKPLSPEEQLKHFKVPPGFEVQLVAAEPEIQKPINLNFDAAGRLWATGSESYPWPAATDALGQPLPNFAKAYEDIASAFSSKGKAPAIVQQGRDTVRVLSEFAPDGHARKVEVFADGLNIPGGVQPLPRRAGAKGDSAIVYSIPAIWRMEDTDGDGKADKKEALYSGFGYLDTHGMSSNYIYWIDGWIYGCHGFRNHSEIKDRNGKVLTVDSGNTYRFKPDGSAFEYYTHGQTNPFGLAFDPMGNLYSADSHSKPVYMLLRGGYYEGIGKQHDGLGFAPRITDDDHGSSAIAGITYYSDEKYPAEFRGNLFNGNPVTQRINRDKLEWHGSTPKAIRQPDFLSCDDPWFRPVQVKLGPDGALYIADFYNPIIGHYEVPLSDPRRDHSHGRIWRVVWKGDKADAPVAQPPDISKAGSEELIASMASPSLEVRRLATNELVERVGESAIEPLAKSIKPDGFVHVPEGEGDLPSLPFWEESTDVQHSHEMWAYERLKPGANDLRMNLLAVSSMIGVHTAKIAAERPTSAAGFAEADPLIERGLVKGKPLVQRALTDLYALRPDEHGLSRLLAVASKAPDDDVELRHAALIALRNQLLVPANLTTAKQLAEADPKTAERLADAALGAPTADAAALLFAHLQRTKFNAPHATEQLRHVATNLPQEKLPEVTSFALDQLANAALDRRLAAIDALNTSFAKRGYKPGGDWDERIQRTMTDALSSTDAALLDRAIAAVREAKLEAKYEPLRAIVLKVGEHGPRRAAALEALMNLDRGRGVAVAALNDTSSMSLRKRAAELLGQAKSDNAAREALGNALTTAPWELATAIAAGLAKSDAGCEQLLAIVESGKATPALLRNNLVAGPLASRPQPLKDRATALTKDLPPEDARLDGVIANRVETFRAASPGPARGAAVFQQNCAACHKVKSQGGNVGPNLDGVASRGVHRLIEDILDPNRNVDPAFRQTVLEATDGRTLAGVNFRTEGELVILNDATGQEISLPKAQVKAQTQSRLSLMPPTFEQAIATNDFNDLLAFLLTQSATTK